VRPVEPIDKLAEPIRACGAVAVGFTHAPPLLDMLKPDSVLLNASLPCRRRRAGSRVPRRRREEREGEESEGRCEGEGRGSVRLGLTLSPSYI
jgi:hypothetical protein